MLVPTTILAQQHLGTFRERLAEFPIEIEMVSRLRKPAEVEQALAGFADGKVDILIGTHRLLSRDVRAAELGLLDRRRGAALRRPPEGAAAPAQAQGRRALDVGDADPADAADEPGGLRDISVIETPPEGRRPIRTYVGPYDEELVAGPASEVRCDGQAFFLHNSVDDLHVANFSRARASSSIAASAW